MHSVEVGKKKSAYIIHIYMYVTTSNPRARRALGFFANEKARVKKEELSSLGSRTDRPENLPRVLQPRQDQAAVC